ARSTDVEHELRERQVLLVARHAIELRETHLRDLMARPDRLLAAPKGRDEQIGRAKRDVEQRALPRRLVMRHGGLVEVPEVVELVTEVGLVDPAGGPGPGMWVQWVDGTRRVQV